MTTYHAIQRTKERAGLNKRTGTRFITNAIKRGRGAEAFGSVEREYLRHESKDGYRAIAYNAFCFIVSKDNNCVTMYPLPSWFGKKRYYQGKLKIRDTKKYICDYAQPEPYCDVFNYPAA